MGREAQPGDGTLQNLDECVEWIEAWARGRIAARTERGIARKGGSPEADVYAASDLVCILSTIRRLDLTADERAVLVREVARFQRPDTGEFVSDGFHSVYHATAFALAALELLDAVPPTPLRFAEPLLDWANLERWLEGRNWERPWSGAGHDVPGLASAFAVTESAPLSWFHRLFDWLDREQDPRTGMWRRGAFDEPTIDQLGAAFHFYFIYEHFHRPIPRCDAIVDTTLALQLPGGSFNQSFPAGFIDLDGAYTLSRASRVAQDRRDAALVGLRRLAAYTLDAVLDGERRTRIFDNTHTALGTVACLAALQEALPDELPTRRPLRSVLDRRPFI